MRRSARQLRFASGEAMTGRAPEKAILMRRRGKSLVPFDARAEEALERLKPDDVVLVWAKKPRNPKHHAKFMAMVDFIFQHQSRYRTKDHLLTAIKLRAGLFENYIVDGKAVAVPGSVSFDKMGQVEFEEFYDRVMDIIVTEIVPAMKKADLKRELLGFVDTTARAPGGDERAQR
jgi:hypothetical protein